MTTLADVNSALDQVVTHVTAAGAALTNPIRDVAQAHPIPTSSRCIRVWYAGEADPSKMGATETLGDRMIGISIQIVAWWAMSGQGTVLAATVDTEALELTYQINTRLIGDSTLGGKCVDLIVRYAETGFETDGQTGYRTLAIEVIPHFVDLYAIAS